MEILALRWLLVALASIVGIVDAAVVAQAALAADNPPIVSIGPVTDPAGAVTGSGTVDSGGQTDACVNGQSSDANPADTVSVNGACQAAGSSGSQAGGQAGTGSASGTGSSTGSGARTGAVAGAAATATVAARDARGIKISQVRYIRSALRSTGRLRVIVTVRDRDGRLIRDAIVTLRPLRGAKPTLAGSIATFTDRLGRASFSVPVAKRAFGLRLKFVVSARTPSAQALEWAFVRLSPSATS